MFRQAFLCEEMGDLYWEPDHQVWRWLDAEVYVSMTRRESAIFCHFSAKPEALRHLKAATNEFVELALELMPWCQVVMGSIKRDSVARLMEKCGFEHVLDHDYLKVYARYRKWPVAEIVAAQKMPQKCKRKPSGKPWTT